MRRNRVSGLIIAGLTACLSVAAFAQDAPVRKLQLTFNAGRVTLVAQNVTPREIMIEWARQCGCVVKDGDKVPGVMITIPVMFENQPESVVLASVLRGAAGYALVPRLEGTVGPSIYSVVSVVPVSAPTTSTGFSPMPAPVATTPDDELPPVTPVINANPGPAPASQPATVAPGASQPGAVQPGRGGPGVPVYPVGPGRGGGGGK